MYYAHTCNIGSTCIMYVVITCNYSCQHKKIEKKMLQRVRLTQSHLVISQVFVISVPISSILFNSLLQLLLTDRNPQFHPLSVLFLIPDVDQLFITLGEILFHCFVSSTPASVKSVSMPADDTGMLKIYNLCPNCQPFKST